MKEAQGNVSTEATNEAEYKRLFDEAWQELDAITKDARENDLGRRSVTLEIDSPYIQFFRNDKEETVGVDFGREGEELEGSTIYTFKNDGKVYLTGWVGENFGPETLPDIIYAEKHDEFPAERHDQLLLDLNQLNDLVKFILHPLRNRALIESLQKIPGEGKLIRHRSNRK